MHGPFFLGIPRVVPGSMKRPAALLIFVGLVVSLCAAFTAVILLARDKAHE